MNDDLLHAICFKKTLSRVIFWKKAFSPSSDTGFQNISFLIFCSASTTIFF